MEYKALARELKSVFDKKGYQWKIDGVLTSPSKEDILETMMMMAERLEGEPSGTWLELGHLIFIKTEGFIDVYMHHGTVERQDEQATTEPMH